MRTVSLLVGLSVALAGCRGYRAGSFTGPRGAFDGERRTVGCLDVAVEATQDAAAAGPIAGVTIANRCDVGVMVDLSALRARGRTPDGSEIRLRPYDPAFEIRPAMLEARSVATEHLELIPADGDAPLFTQWCVDVSRIDRSRPSARPVEMCFANGVRA